MKKQRLASLEQCAPEERQPLERLYAAQGNKDILIKAATVYGQAIP